MDAQLIQQLNVNQPARKTPVKFGLSIAIVIICLVATAVAVYWIKTEPTEQPLPNIVIKKLVDQTAGWQTYKNDTYGFEIKYPPVLQTGPSGVAEAGFFELELSPSSQGPAAHASFIFRAKDNHDKISVEGYCSDYYNNDKYIATPIYFHGKEAVDFKSRTGKLYYPPEEIVIPMDSWFIRIEINDAENAYNSYQPGLIDSILATFNFIEAHPIPYVAPTFKTYRNDKYGFSMRYPSDMPELQVFENSTSTIYFSLVAGSGNFEVHFFNDPNQFHNPIYNSDEDNSGDLGYSTNNQQWIVTSNSDNPGVCPYAKTDKEGLTFYNIGTGHHAGDSFNMYITNKGLIAVVGEQFNPDNITITFDNPASVLKVGCLAVKK